MRLGRVSVLPRTGGRVGWQCYRCNAGARPEMQFPYVTIPRAVEALAYHHGLWHPKPSRSVEALS